MLLHILRGKVDLRLADASGASSKTEAMKRMEQARMYILVTFFKDFFNLILFTKDKALEQNGSKAGPSTASQAEISKEATTRLARLQSLSGAIKKGSSPLPSTCMYRYEVFKFFFSSE